MNELEFKNLLDKQKRNTLTIQEKELLNRFETTLLEKNKANIFRDEAHKDQLRDSILEGVNQQKTSKKQFNLFPVAASIVLLVSLGIGFSHQNGLFKSKPEHVVDVENITIQLDDGTTQIINENTSSQLVDKNGHILGNQRGNQLVYASDVKKEVLVYNTLTVPFGKRFELQLSDGTNVHLNAGTSLKYPVNFIKGKDRKVFLIGEAYFNVAKDSEHPFIVNTNEIDVRVLGTQFNVSSYPEDTQISTVLIEGAVSIYKIDEAYNDKTATDLKPGFKATFQKGGNHISIEEADTEMHTAWIDGRIIFRRVPFDKIIKKLERHYNVKIINNNESLNNIKFGASFDIETIEQALEALNENYNIDYKIEKHTIIIN